jgi:hypothetical protein
MWNHVPEAAGKIKLWAWENNKKLSVQLNAIEL